MVALKRRIQNVVVAIMHVKKHLSFTSLRKNISRRFKDIEEHRQGKVDYSLHDCLMSALAVMFFQDPSLLSFQRRHQETSNFNNLKSIFKVQDIPGDTQLRDTLDEIEPEGIEVIYNDFFQKLQRGKHLESYQVLNGYYYMPIDGSQYFSSERINCPSCLFKTTSKGKTRYYHQILQPVLVHPDKRQVIPLAPEQIKNEDGTKKQDCEINAAKRVLKKIRKDHPKLKIIIGGDGLYSKQPFIDQLKKNCMSYVLVAKPDDHKVMNQWLSELREMNETQLLELTDDKGRRHRYEWASGLPLNGGVKSDDVNYFEYTLIREGKSTYRNSWVTDLAITEENIVELVKVGRARWKIENEAFNTLKNQGYHLKHNFGHGQKNLSYNFFLLNVLAFLAHQIFELTDRLYQKCRVKAGARIEFWNKMRYAFEFILFQNFEHLLNFIFKPPDLHAP